MGRAPQRAEVTRLARNPDEAYRQGAQAYATGVGIDRDPYRGVFGPWYGTESPESAAWRAGYMDAWQQEDDTLTRTTEGDTIP